MIDDTTNLPIPIDTGRGRMSTIEQLADIPEETIWLVPGAGVEPGL